MNNLLTSILHNFKDILYLGGTYNIPIKAGFMPAYNLSLLNFSYGK